MRLSSKLLTAVLLLMGGISVVQGEDKPTSKDLGKIQPPGGVPLPLAPGTPQLQTQHLLRNVPGVFQNLPFRQHGRQSQAPRHRSAG